MDIAVRRVNSVDSNYGIYLPDVLHVINVTSACNIYRQKFNKRVFCFVDVCCFNKPRLKFRLRNYLHCLKWVVKLYSLTYSLARKSFVV